MCALYTLAGGYVEAHYSIRDIHMSVSISTYDVDTNIHYDVLEAHCCGFKPVRSVNERSNTGTVQTAYICQ